MRLGGWFNGGEQFEGGTGSESLTWTTAMMPWLALLLASWYCLTNSYMLVHCNLEYFDINIRIMSKFSMVAEFPHSTILNIMPHLSP